MSLVMVHVWVHAIYLPLPSSDSQDWGEQGLGSGCKAWEPGWDWEGRERGWD